MPEHPRGGSDYRDDQGGEKMFDDISGSACRRPIAVIQQTPTTVYQAQGVPPRKGHKDD